MKMPLEDDSFDEDADYNWISGTCFEGYCFDFESENFELSSYCQN